MNQHRVRRATGKWQRFLLLALLGIAVSLGSALQLRPAMTQPLEASPHQFDGRALVIASDADMVATAYSNGKLDRVAGIEDTLTVLPLPFSGSFSGSFAEDRQSELATVPVSNSVMSWPQIIAVSPDGQRAYIAEVRGTPPDDVQEYDSIEEMPEGQFITVVDLSDPSQPSVLESVAVGRNPNHISISPDGRFLAVNLEEPGRELLIIQLTPEGRFGRRADFPISTTQLGQDEAPDNRPIVWHPSGRFLAANQGSDTQVAFYAVETRNDGEIQIRPFGSPIEVGNHLSSGRFTADGQFFLVPDLKWSTHSSRAKSFLLNPRGEMISIRFDEVGKQHEVVSRATVGLSPEGFALSPDNSLIATVNMRRTYLARRTPPIWKGRARSSLSLVQLDPDSGELNTLDEYPFEGLLPEQASFDQDGDALAVVIFHDREPAPQEGAVEFWNVFSGQEPRLEATGVRVPVVRGAHDIVLLPQQEAGPEAEAEAEANAEANDLEESRL